MRKPALKSVATKGFTLIELLIVIALIGILAVALLSVINPLEQLKKARDAGKKSDSAELLNAYERYYSTFGCFPWSRDVVGKKCNVPATTRTGPNPDFTLDTQDKDLVTTEEVKTQVSTRFSGDYALKFWISETAQGQVSICFEPESKTARSGGLGPLKLINNTGSPTCGSSYSGGGNGASCYVCMPQ